VLVKKKVNDQKLRSVVFVSSIASQFGAKGFSIYSASKGALDALMKSLAVELAPGVRVIAAVKSTNVVIELPR
jgi:NAD(P)-dependent dehydrogenase (short-subunit alcohol dehydrogenase family)